MVYKITGWFVFEPGDLVSILPYCRKAIVVEALPENLDTDNKQQVVSVRLRNGSLKKVNSNRLELIKGVPTVTKLNAFSR